jgi:hypothetical protein
LDDSVVDGSVNYVLTTGDPTSTDTTYDALGPSDVANVILTNTDDDTVGLVVTESSGTTAITENGTTDDYTIALSTEPSADVTITTINTGDTTTSPTTLTFTTTNWATPQTITITAVDDNILEGAETVTIAHSTTSTDTYYQGVSTTLTGIAVTDNATIIVAPTTATTTTTTTSSSGGGGGIATTIATAPTVVAAAKPVTVKKTKRNCKKNLTILAPVDFGNNNDPQDVRIIEWFLNTYEGKKLPIDGIYSRADRAAVIQWQEKYTAEILKPWGITKGTGYVYLTSIAQMKKVQKNSCKAQLSKVIR